MRANTKKYPTDDGRSIIDGVEFAHGFTDVQEYHEHRAGKRTYGLFRHTTAGDTEMGRVWFAFVTERGGGSAVLNTAVVNHLREPTRKGVLYDLNARDPEALMRGLVPYIERNEWPSEIVVTKEEEVPA